MNECYLFDFDGTLVDSMPTFISTMLRILDENQIPYEEDIVKTITPLGLEGTARYYIETLGLQLSREHLMSLMMAYMQDNYFYHIPPKAHVPEVLQILKNRGASLNVLTASPHVTLDACLKRLGLWDLFDNVWSCDDFHTTKADPGIYRSAAAKIGLPVEQILFLDDNPDACQTAKNAHMAVCGVFDPSSKGYVERMKAIGDYYIFDFSELPDLLQRG